MLLRPERYTASEDQDGGATDETDTLACNPIGQPAGRNTRPIGAVFAAEPDNPSRRPYIQIVIGLVVALFGCLALAPLFLADRRPR